MVMLLNLLSFACSIVGLVCFVMVVIQMFKRDESTMGIVSLVLILCCGIGFLVAFVYGWIKVSAWDLKKVMIAWTCVFVLNLILSAIGFAIGAATAVKSGEFNVDPNMNFNMEGVDFEMDNGGFNIELGDPEVTPDADNE